MSTKTYRTYAEHDNGVIEVLRVQEYLDNATHAVVDVVTCGSCGRSWDDAVITGITPAPSGRCPFEHDHTYDD